MERGLCKRLHLRRHVHIVVTKATAVVRRQRHLDAVVHVEPLRVVVHLLGQERGPGHERPRLRKVNKLKRFLYRIAIALNLPTLINQRRNLSITIASF